MDMLSELPLGIIHNILALVPIRDAVRTCILSRQWRYTWTSLPDLVFEQDTSFGYYGNSIKVVEDDMENLITHVVSLHNGPIQSFRLSVPFKRKCLNFGVWLLLLARNDIREIYIGVGCRGHWAIQELHSSIYSCKKLTTLELYNCKLDPPPTFFKAFLFLRRLLLDSVLLPNNEVQGLVANCPILEELTLRFCQLPKQRISAPKLKVLNVEVTNYVEMSVHAPLLAELSVRFASYDPQQKSSVCSYSKLLGGFSNLEKLHGEGFFPLYMSMGVESCRHTLVFRRLKDIMLTYVDFEDIKCVSVVARLILGAPSLEKLKLSHASCTHYEAPGEPKAKHVSFSDFGCTPDFKLEKLNFVEMWNVNGLPPQMAFVRFLLERSPALATMTFHGVYRSKRKLNAEFKGCRKASPNVKLAIFTIDGKYR